ncbi:A24 family peptidase [Enterobacter ludwigii]|uniref:prepilin peptidase n=1 Tax=Enterobacter ludwigii TaxID=299767 RepID=UPI00242FBAF2|nr:A24 family peptidase [Enterobacter ludwigii]WGC20687.1 A24 family peptidase [Enterobacter ludwigii]
MRPVFTAETLVTAGIAPLFFVLLLWLVRDDLRTELARLSGDDEWHSSMTETLWIVTHSGVMSLYWLAEAGLWSTCSALLFCVFVFRLTLIDQLTGYLPREMTLSFLAAGLLVASAEGTLLRHAGSALTVWCCLMLWRLVGYRLAGQETLGMGDVWLGGALGAWLGLLPALYVTAVGAGGFFIWLMLSRRAGGPMGPWFGYCALGAMLIPLYQLM